MGKEAGIPIKIFWYWYKKNTENENEDEEVRGTIELRHDAKDNSELAICEMLTEHVDPIWEGFSLTIGKADKGVFTQSLWQQHLKRLRHQPERAPAVLEPVVESTGKGRPRSTEYSVTEEQLAGFAYESFVPVNKETVAAVSQRALDPTDSVLLGRLSLILLGASALLGVALGVASCFQLSFASASAVCTVVCMAFLLTGGLVLGGLALSGASKKQVAFSRLSRLVFARQKKAKSERVDTRGVCPPPPTF